MIRPLVFFTAASLCTAADLTHATVVAPSTLTAPERKAVALLVDAVRERTRLTWPVAVGDPGEGTPVVRIAEAPAASKLPAEGYRLRSFEGGVEITGNDERGVLFGVGGLLRALEMRRDSVTLPRPLDVTTAPKYPLRGHQLGYRPKTNSYDGWDVPDWERYIRDLAVFGANAIELIPPRSDDAADSPHFPLPQMQMMIEMSRLARGVRTAVWIWYPAMDRDYCEPGHRGLRHPRVGRSLPPASARRCRLRPRRRSRPHAAEIPDGAARKTDRESAPLPSAGANVALAARLQAAWMDEFLGLLKQQSGMAFRRSLRPAGTSESTRVAAARAEAIPHPLLSRHHPQHQRQYHRRRLGRGLCATEEREVINPRPVDEAADLRVLQPYTNGFLTYSEGCNDDVNKARLERPWLESGRRPRRGIARLRPLLHRRRHG